MRRSGKVRATPPAVTWMVGWLTLTCSRLEGRLRRVCAGVVAQPNWRFRPGRDLPKGAARIDGRPAQEGQRMIRAAEVREWHTPDTGRRLYDGVVYRSPAAFVVPTVLAPPARPVLSAVAAVPAVLPVSALLIVPVALAVGTVATDPASPAVSAVTGGAEEQRGRGHPPEGIEKAEAEQDDDRHEKQNEHGGPPRSGTNHHCRGPGPVHTA